MKIIDTHVHLTEMLGFVMTEEMVIHMMDKYNIDYCIVSNGDSAEYDHELKPVPIELQFSQKDSFMRTIRFARQNPGKIGVMPWIKPATETVDEDFLKIMKENSDIIKGIKIHPFHSKTSIASERVKPYLELAAKLKLPVASHTGGCEEASPVHVMEMAKKYPDIPFIMVHMGLGTDNKEAVELMAEADNLYADTTWVPVSTTLEVIKRYGSERIMFGSDAPIDGLDTYYCNKLGEPSLYREYFNGLREIIGDKAYANLMYKNAERIFKL